MEISKMGEPHFTQTGQFLRYSIVELEGKISDGIKNRLFRYAQKRIKEVGLDFLEEWPMSVYTLDGDKKLSERRYTIQWENKNKTIIALCCITTRKNYPFFDYGFEIEED